MPMVKPAYWVLLLLSMEDDSKWETNHRLPRNFLLAPNIFRCATRASNPLWKSPSAKSRLHKLKNPMAVGSCGSTGPTRQLHLPTTVYLPSISRASPKQIGRAHV